MRDQRVLRSDAAIASIEGWLAEKRITLWGASFVVTEDEGRRAAAEWMQEQMASWIEWTERDG